jgi:hypothetical protein
VAVSSIAEKILAYHGVRGEHDRDRSWEYCYKYFHHANAEAIKADRHHAALQLGFYLASWGMYRGSAFLLQYAYTVHLGVVDCLLESKFSKSWTEEFGASANDVELADLILEACQDIRTAYRPFGEATDTLVTKVVLGTMGCFPALDTYFNDGCKHSGISVPSRLDSKFIQEIRGFCQNNLGEFQSEQARIEHTYGMRYPLMKLVDMYFHQIGLELAKDDLKQRLARYKRIKISVIGTTFGQTNSISIRFVLVGEKVYLLPEKGSDTQWYKNLLRNPSIRIEARGLEAEFRATPITNSSEVKSVLENFREKYGARDVEKYYSKFDVAVVAELANP